MSKSNPFRIFWQPNSRSASPLPQDLTAQVENLKQKLDTAEKKVEEYEKLIASLFVALRRDTVCQTCKENVIRILAASSPTNTTKSAAQPTPVDSTIFSGLTNTTLAPSDPEPTRTTSSVQGPAFPISSSLSAHANQSSGIGQDAAVHFCSSNPQGQYVATSISDGQPTFPTLTTPSQNSPDADSEPSQMRSPSLIIEAPTNADSSQPNPDPPDWSVEYNPDINKSLSLHLANTFTFTDVVFCTKFSRDGKYLAVGLRNGEIHIYCMTTGSKRIRVLARRSATVFYTDAAEPLTGIWTVQFSPDSKYIATGGYDGKINIFEIDRRRLRAIFEHERTVECIDFSPNGRILASASDDQSICMWSIRDGSRRTLWHESNVISVAFSPDGRYVAAGNRDGFVRIWGARTSQLLAKYEIGYEWPRAVIFTSDGKGIVIGGRAVQGLDVGMLKEGRSREHAIQDGTCNLMNPTFEFTGHKGMINALSFSSDNRWLLSCSRDHNVCILDARSSAWVCTLKAHTNYVWGADFSPAGHYIVSGGGDCRVRLWRYELVE